MRLDEALKNGADNIVEISGDDNATIAAYAKDAAEVDVVIDYVWGRPTELAMQGILGVRTDHERILDWVQVGGMGGLDITSGGHMLRHNALRISGSGFGSVPMDKAKLPELAAAIASGAFAVQPRVVPLADVEQAWTHEDAKGERTVIVL